MPAPSALGQIAERSLARGVLGAVETGAITLTLPGTDYRLRLLVKEDPVTAIGQRIAGTINAQARRVDLIRSGGMFIEPVAGRPRRVQGRIVAIDATNNALVVNAGAPMVCRLNALQKPEQFQVGQLVCFDVEPGATFTPEL